MSYGWADFDPFWPLGQLGGWGMAAESLTSGLSLPGAALQTIFWKLHYAKNAGKQWRLNILKIIQHPGEHVQPQFPCLYCHMALEPV